MNNYSLILNKMPLFVKTHKSMISRKQNYLFLRGHLSWREIKTPSYTQEHNEKIHNVILNKLCNIFSEDFFQKKKTTRKC